MMVWVRSLLFQVYFFASLSISSIAVVICWFFPFRVHYAIAKAWADSMMYVGKHLCGLDYVVEGEENIPDVPSVVMIKHTTVFETYAQLSLFPTQSWVLKHELKWIPFFGWGLAAMKPIAIDRSAGIHAVQQVVQQGKSRLSDGIWITIFPEGTRMAPGETRRYGVSGALLATEAGVSILPVAHNAGDLWPRRGLKKEPGLIRVCIGPAIDPGDRKPKETNLLVQEWIENKMLEISTCYQRGDSDS